MQVLAVIDYYKNCSKTEYNSSKTSNETNSHIKLINENEHFCTNPPNAFHKNNDGTYISMYILIVK